jgi:sugar phosphate isomerase/epimerase
MPVMSRRQFLARSACALSAASLLSTSKQILADPLGLPIGCQVFPIRERLMRDFDGTLRDVRAMGYRVIEFCSPPSFEKMGFGPIVNMKGSEIRERATGAGLAVPSCHFQYHELKDHLDERLVFAHELGLKDMIVATLAIPPDAPLDDWNRAADVMNGLGERTQAAGIQLGFHNHGFEFKRIGDVLIFDELMSRFDPKLVKSQFQVANAFDHGFDPAAYLKKYPGRFVSLHMAGYLTAEKKVVPVGSGSIDWKSLFGAAKESGLQYLFVEMDWDALPPSYQYLRDLKVG